jgi:hypothetical protein
MQHFAHVYATLKKQELSTSSIPLVHTKHPHSRNHSVAFMLAFLRMASDARDCAQAITERHWCKKACLLNLLKRKRTEELNWSLMLELRGDNEWRAGIKIHISVFNPALTFLHCICINTSDFICKCFRAAHITHAVFLANHSISSDFDCDCFTASQIRCCFRNCKKNYVYNFLNAHNIEWQKCDPLNTPNHKAVRPIERPVFKSSATHWTLFCSF